MSAARRPPAWWLLSTLLACAPPLGAPMAGEMPVRLLDGFEDIGLWKVSASDEVKAALRSTAGSEGNALCMEFDFGAVSGYAVMRRELPLEYPENYEFSFDLRGAAPANTLQFKLIDASGENVWWVNRPDYEFPGNWQRVRFKKRHIEFAWGPAKDPALKRSAALELVVARGQGGGKGAVCFDRLEFRRLPAARSTPPAPLVRASSTLAPTAPAYVIDGAPDTSWRSNPAAGLEQTLTLDFREPREFGGLVLHWSKEAFASRYSIDLSDDGEHWRTVRRVTDGNGGADPHFLPESESRYLRLRLHDGPAKAYALAEIEVKPLAYGASPNAFFHAIAREAPRGHYPRGFADEQSYWTVVGIDGGMTHGLLSEDGALEFGPRSASIEPFLLADERLITWADVETRHALLDNYLPIPTVSWRHRDLALHVTAFGAGDRARSQLVSHYTVENLADRPRLVTLMLAIRPFQVNPPTQFLNMPGGVTLLRELSWDGEALGVNGARRLFPLQKPDEVIIADFDAGGIPDLLARSRSDSSRIADETGFATGLLLYRVELPPRASRRIAIVAPLTGMPALPPNDASGWVSEQQAQTAEQWRRKLNHVVLRLPHAAQALGDTLRTALAHILISRSGPALQPGVRAYARSWIRDGAMMSDALSRLGHAAVGREFIEWFAPRQFASGKVPCCVDSRGSDPVAENDSHGELVHAISEHYRYSRDGAWLESMWPRVASAAGYMDALRAGERGEKNQARERRAFYGLMPPSISHEGYADRPAYSYWDDFWTLAGYDSAVAVARALGRERDHRRFAGQREEFSGDLHASLRASIARHGIDYIPGSADRGDFDPTSTTIALTVARQQDELPRRELQHSFERYWQEFLRRRDEATGWDVYTPYELRNVGVFVRLGWRERANALLEFFLADRRPAAWNQWAEVVGREARRPRFIGDMPHAWVGSDFIGAVLDLFAYERAGDQALVLAGGIPNEWLAGDGVGIERLRTPYGELSYALRRDGRRLLLTVGGELKPPQGGLVFAWPYGDAPGTAFLNGRSVPWESGRVLRIRTLPAEIAIEAAP